jgi:pSer/pThr/pTyr-binding forkhead associated (FHA) protein
MQCPHCGRESDPLFKFCLHCGKELGGRKAPKAEPKPAEPKAEPKVEARPEPKPEPKPEPAQAKAAPGSAPEAAADGASVRCPRCRAKIAAGVPVCRLCGFKIGQGQGAPERAVAEPGPETVMASTRKPGLGYLISVSSVDGRETVRVQLKAGKNTLGRGSCDIRFPEDDLLAPQHLTLEVSEKEAQLIPEDSRNGTYLRMSDQVQVGHGNLFRIGQQLLRYEDLAEVQPLVAAKEEGTQVLGSPSGPKAWGRLTQVVGETVDGNSFLLASENVFLGRERGNITFPGDRYISGTHAVLTRKADGTWLRDVGSSNGTYVRVPGPILLPSGQFFLAGRQLFKLQLGQ